MTTKTIAVTNAKYLGPYKVKVTFNDGTSKVVDFGPSLKKIRVPEYMKYREPEHFRKFKIEGGNLVWGKDWDLIYPVHQLYEGKINC